MIAEYLPKIAMGGPAVGAASLWMAIHLTYIGPEIANRVAQVDYLRKCVVAIDEARRRATKEKGCELAGSALDWLAPELKGILPPDVLCEPLERHLDTFAEEISKSSAGMAEEACRCATRKAVELSRMDWSLFTATGGLFKTERLRRFEDLIDEIIFRGQCTSHLES